MSVNACAELVRKGDPDRFLAAMAARPPERALLFPLYAFNLEIARAPWIASEPMLAEIRLQWWRDALSEIYTGQVPRRHEVVEPLAAVIGATDLPRPLLDALIDARAFDAYGDPHPGRAAFDAYVTATGGNLMRLAALALGADANAAAIAGQAGAVHATGMLFEALPALYAANWDPVPVLGPIDRNAIAESRVPPPLAEALRSIASDALDRLAGLRTRRMEIPPEIRPALLPLWRAEAALKRAATAPDTMLAPVPPLSEFARRWGFLSRSVTGRW
ncbi:MAG: squalene/phytoene synthase family protein [Rubricella sp.]